MTILVTGAAGFIGSSLILKLLENNTRVIGVDNHNSYYNPQLKEDRLKNFLCNPDYIHFRNDISDKNSLDKIFKKFTQKIVINLAAQAGVRYSIENPDSYIKSNIVGFANILECCRDYKVEHLIYASSSSVYGANTNLPYSTHDFVDHPLSLYAATKKSNELFAHSYSNLYGIKTSGLRLFTVYGPWGRPDMALFKFTESIINEMPIDIYNSGAHTRDFTFIDDVVDGIIKVIQTPASVNKSWKSNSPDPSSSFKPWRIYNIGNGKPISLIDFVSYLEKALNKKAKKNFVPKQLGDIEDTEADIDDSIKLLGYSPAINIKDGIDRFVSWYINYYKIK